MYKAKALLFLLLMTFSSQAQDYSTRGLMDIKEQAEAHRLNWNKAFEEAVQTQNFSSLTEIRTNGERFLDRHISGTRRAFAAGDARPLLTAVNNYLQISRQFIKDVMVPAESLAGTDQEGINNIYQKISDFGQKEQMFLVDIENALLSEPQNQGVPVAAEEQMEEQEDELFEEPRGSVIEGRSRKTRGKLPHEQYEEPKKKRRKR